MKYGLVSFCLLMFLVHAAAQKRPDIDVQEVSRIEAVLSSDSMEGRSTFSAGIDKAARFIAQEFSKSGLKPGGSNGSYLQAFSVYQGKIAEADVLINGMKLQQDQVICNSTQQEVVCTPDKGFETAVISAKESFMQSFRKLRSSNTNRIVFIDTVHRASFKMLKNFSGPRLPTPYSQIYILTHDTHPSSYAVRIRMQLTEQRLANVVGILPGKSKKEELVIFSGHYDHLGYGKPDEKGDSLYNGANDDASGTTAVITLANYFSKLGRQKRTLVFAAFTAEESGGFGSGYFSKQYNPEKITAMFNIEMIGTTSKWGGESAYITGYEKSSMGEILAKNLQGTPFRFYPDPYPQQNLFYRSDNATLARLGVPAHTISTSKMDNEPHYHKPSDEFGTLDMNNMAKVIKAIALSSRSIVAGKDRPTRVDVSQIN